MMGKTFQKRIESPNGFVPGSKYHSVDIAHLLIDGYITSGQRVVKRSVILLDASARFSGRFENKSTLNLIDTDTIVLHISRALLADSIIT